MPSFYVLALIILTGIQLKGQPSKIYPYRELTVSDGLPDASVSRIIQDKRGYIWLATLNGIARYDGNRIRNYHPAKEMDPEASNRDFPYLHVSDSGNFWVGYLRGKHALFRYDEPRDSFMYFNPFAGTVYSDSLLSVRAILEDREKRLWIATSLKGAFRIDMSDEVGDTLKYHYYREDSTKDNSLPTNFMAPGLWQDPSGQIWMLTEAGLVEYRAATDDFTTYRWSEVPLENEGMMLTPDTLRNCLWIATFNGLVRFDMRTKRTKRYQFVPGAPVKDSPNFIPVVNLDRSGRLWVTRGGYPTSTLWIFDPDQETFHPVVGNDLNNRKQLPGSLHQYTDNNGIIWSGSFLRGVQAIHPVAGNVRRVMLPGMPAPGESFDESGILAIAEYSPDIFFIGTLAQGVWRWDRKLTVLSRVKIPGLDEAADSVRVNDLVFASEHGLLWVITPKTVYEYHVLTGKSSSLRVLEGAAGTENYRLACYGEGWLWGGSLGQGAYRFKADEPDVVRHFSQNKKDSPQGHLPYGGISDIKPGVEPGQFWLASVYGGLMEWRAELQQFQSHPTQRDLRRILPTPDGLLWLVSPGGVRLYDPRSQNDVSLPSVTGEALAHPLSVARGLDGRVWVGTVEGVVAVDEQEYSVIHRFAASAWLEDEDSWSAGLIYSLVASTGEIYFANVTGLFVVDPGKVRYDTVPPEVALQTFTVNGRRQPLPSWPADEISLHPDSNDLNFTLAVLHFLSPEENRLNYLLEGFDTEWKTTDPETVLAFQNLAPGKYRLLVRGVNGDGTTGEIQELINIRIVPRWYATSLAYLIYLMFFLSIGYGWFWVISGRKDWALITLDKPVAKKTQEHAFIIMAREVVLKNLAEREFGPDQMAAALSLSRSQLHRRLGKLGGVSTTHFINATRLTAAKEKLADPTFTVAEIAYDCGYSDPSYFSRKFRELYGLSPTEFRAKG